MWHSAQLVLRKWQCRRLFIKVSTHDGQAGTVTPILDSLTSHSLASTQSPPSSFVFGYSPDRVTQPPLPFNPLSGWEAQGLGSAVIEAGAFPWNIREVCPFL